MGRLHHANIRITDPAASLRFYQALGLEYAGTLSMGPGYTLLYLADGRGLAPPRARHRGRPAGRGPR